MIFAAGLGSRLRPLTNNKPKALVKVAGFTMLDLALRKMEQAGINKVIVNIHHHGEQIRQFLKTYQTSHMKILVSDESDKLLDTGGGLLKAQPLFDTNTPILLYNVDIITTTDLKHFSRFHHEKAPLASLMVKKRPTSRHLLFDNQMNLIGWHNIKTGEKILAKSSEIHHSFGFQGIHIISPDIFGLIEETGTFSIMELYLRLAANHILKGFDINVDNWFDIGTPDKLKQAEQYIKTII